MRCLITLTALLCAALTPFQRQVESARQQVATECGIYDLIHADSFGHDAIFLQLIEEEALYMRIGAPAASSELIESLRSSLMRGMSEKEVRRFVKHVRETHTMRPSEFLCIFGEFKHPFLHIPGGVVRQWSQILPSYAQMPEIQNYLTIFLDTLKTKKS